MNQKPNNVVALNITLTDFFRYWFEFLAPFHHLTKRQTDVIVSFVKLRYELSKVITDEKLLDDNVMSENSKRKVREECNISLPHFQVIMGELRKNKVIVDGKINPRYIPRITNEEDFKLLLYFQFDGK